MSNIIIVSNRLPVTVGEEIKKSAGGLAAALEGVSAEGGKLTWIGNPGGAGEDLKEREKIERVLQEEYGFVPIFFTEEESKAYYEGFSNSSLWPLLHYMTQYFRYEPGWWEAYQQANRKFAEKVLAVAGDDDTVWVHDYHLMLLPAMLREARPDLRIGFFLHTPFPSYEIFRCHPQRRELIEGLLGADLIGFHTFGYMRHFRSSALRLLGIESEMTRIRRDGHATTLGVYPVGIHAERFVRQFADSKHAENVAKIAKENEGKKIVLSVERLDYTKGIRHRLDAIDAYLARHEKHDDVKFIFVSVPSREGVREYQSLLEEIEQRVGQLNGKYATLHNSPIHFIHGTVDFPELCALYARADVAIVTPLIDGMNLVAKEYIACQKDHPGVLILSEFAGAAEELFNALIVNPYDPQSVAEAIEQALAMGPQERADRMTPMRKRVMKYDAQWWAKKFIEDLSAIDPHVQAKESFQKNQEQLAEVIARGGRVGLFLDYDGTLREIQREPQQARPNEQIKSLFKQMAACPGMDVTIISGRRAEDLEAWFGEYSFGLIAEHGASVRSPGEKQWQRMDQGVSYAWKEEIGKLLQQFEDQTPGSFVEDKPTSLVWHYRKSDPEFGEHKAKLLASELAVLAANEPVVIRHGDKIVEVVPAQISKGAAVQRIVEAEHYDLVVCAGDDQTDESMFKLELDHLITIKVGEGDTLAKVRLGSPGEFRRFLEGALRFAVWIEGSGGAVVRDFGGAGILACLGSMYSSRRFSDIGVPTSEADKNVCPTKLTTIGQGDWARLDVRGRCHNNRHMPRTITHPALGPLKTKFPDIKLMVGEFRDMVTIVVPREKIVEVCTFLRDDPAMRYDMLAELNGVDYLNYPGGVHRFGVNYGLTSIDHNTRLWLKVFLDPTQDTSPGHDVRDEDVIAKGDPGLKVNSVCSVWPGAEWMEREVYDMLGIIFVNHPDLRRILTWNGYGSYPLRKDYPMRGVGERENYQIVTREGA